MGFGFLNLRPSWVSSNAAFNSLIGVVGAVAVPPLPMEGMGSVLTGGASIFTGACLVVPS
eukprot:3122704-Amphidinium_carterae.1